MEQLNTPQKLNLTNNTPINTPHSLIDSPVNEPLQRRLSFTQGISRLMERVQNSQKTIDQVLDKTSLKV